LAGDNAGAIRSYRSFLRRVPDSPNRAEVDGRIAELQKTIDQEARAKEAPKATPAPEPTPQLTPSPQPTAPVLVASPSATPRARTFKIAGLSLMGFGVAALVTGAVFVAEAKSANDDVNHPKSGAFDPAAVQRRDTFQALDVSFFVIGGVAAATGVTLFLLGRRESPRLSLAPPSRNGVVPARF
jgi:hypothetical protein